MPQPESTPVLDRITTAVTSTGLTTEEFAHLAEIAPGRLTGILSGSRRASSLDLALLAETADVTVDWLLSGTPDPVILCCIEGSQS